MRVAERNSTPEGVFVIYYKARKEKRSETLFLIAPCSTPTPEAFQGRAQKITCYQDEAFKALLGRAMGVCRMFSNQERSFDPSRGETAL